MSDKPQKFDTRILASVVGTRMLCEIGDLYAILNHMTGDNLFKSQLPRANKECRPWLLRWFPELQVFIEAESRLIDELKLSDSDRSSVSIRNRQRIMRDHFESVLRSNPTIRQAYSVPRIPPDDRTVIDPIKEAIEVFGANRAIIATEGEA